MSDHPRALSLFLETCQLRRSVLGEEHPDYAISLNNLAGLHRDMGEPGKALPLFVEASALLRRVHGEKHHAYAASLDNLALLYQEIGEPATALPLLLESRRLHRLVLGPRHPDYAASLNHLAWFYHTAGKSTEALALSSEALGVLESYLDDSFDHLGPQQRNQLLQSVLFNLSVLLTFQDEAGLPPAQRYAPVLSWKGRVAARGSLDRLARERPELRATVGELQSVRGRLVRLGLRTPAPAQQGAWLKELRGLTEAKERLEAALSRRSAAFRQVGQPLTAAELSREMPAGAALVDLLEYTHYTPPKGGKGVLQAEQRLLGFVVRRGQGPVLVRLGARAPIAQAIRRWRAEVQKPPTQSSRAALDRSAQALRERVWAPLSKHLGQVRVVLVAPDGVLCQFPLAALPGSKPGSYLIEEVAVAQIASARQLLDLLQPAQKGKGPSRGLVAVGGVDYGHGTVYPPLPGTAPEAQRCGLLFRRAFPGEPATVLSGTQASLARVRRALNDQRPRHLHLATHGFFEPPRRVERLLSGLAAREDRLTLRRDQSATLGSLPGLRCGLALAGANPSARGETGILTGEDVEGLDLRGCELAVLSACQTALGDIARSQGVLGLQRCFHAAGARTLVTSLWSVQDAATLELMDEFYARLWGKKMSRLEALRQAQLAILRDPERVRRRTQALLADAKKRGVSEEVLRGIKGKLALDLPDGGKIEAAPKRSPEAWWAAFVLSGDWR
jgi:CHAT domain-containing protein